MHGTAPSTALQLLLPVWATLPPPTTRLHCVVVLPVRNESEGLADTLQALAAQTRADGLPVDFGSYEILLLANNCSDDSATLAMRFAQRHPQVRLHVCEVSLPPAQANIGFVRRELMNAACIRLQASRGAGLIASTDGDTRVAPDWLAANLAEIAAGADAVGGRILIDASPPLPPHALRLKRLDEAHALLRVRVADLIDPEPTNRWPSHHQHFGASLAVTAGAYVAVGGVPTVEFLEDDALVCALSAAGYRIRRSPRVRVRTSARLDGRAAVGLAWQFRRWSEAPPGHEPQVEDPATFIARLQRRRALREAGRLDACMAEAGIVDGAACSRTVPITSAIRTLHQKVHFISVAGRSCVQGAGAAPLQP